MVELSPYWDQNKKKKKNHGQNQMDIFLYITLRDMVNEYSTNPDVNKGLVLLWNRKLAFFKSK